MNRAVLPNARTVGERPNHFRDHARKVKAEKLISTIDAHARDIEIDPITNAAAVLRSVVDLVDERGWIGLADEAKVKAPSETTIAAVRREYERRVNGGRDSRAS